MQTLIALHAQNPSMTWFAVGALFIALSLATGVGRLVHPVIGAGAVGGVCALGVKLGFAGEILVFMAAAAGSIGVDVFNVRRRAMAPEVAPRGAQSHNASEMLQTPIAPEAPDVSETSQPPLQFVRASEAAPPSACEPTDPDQETTVPPRRAARL